MNPSQLLPEAVNLQVHGTGVTDTGFIFDFGTVAEERTFRLLLYDHLVQHYTNLDWSIDEDARVVGGSVDNYTPPKLGGLIRVNVSTEYYQDKPSIRISESKQVTLEIKDLHFYIFNFNCMILHFELFLPQSEWRDRETIKRVRFFVQKHQHPSTEFGVDLESILAPVIKKIKHALKHAVQVVEPPLMSTRYLDFTALRADSPTQCLWTHCTLIGVMERGFDPDGDHFQDMLLDVNVDGIQNYALRTNIYTKDGTSSKINGNHPTIFAYVESGDSLVCVPDMCDIRGRRPEEIAKEDWVYWIASHHYTWKLVWDLDRALYIILNRVTMNLKEKSVQKYKDVYKVSAFISNLLLRLDMHEPRNQTSVYYSIYFLERLNAAWRTGEILDAAREKMDVLRDLINQLDEIEDARKSRRMELFLNLLGVFALGSLVLDFIGALSIASTIPDTTVISIALGLPIVFSLVAANLSR